MMPERKVDQNAPLAVQINTLYTRKHIYAVDCTWFIPLYAMMTHVTTNNNDFKNTLTYSTV